MKNKIVEIGVIVIFGSVLGMTFQESFSYGFGIAAGIVIVSIGLKWGEKNSHADPKSEE